MTNPLAWFRSIRIRLSGLLLDCQINWLIKSFFLYGLTSFACRQALISQPVVHPQLSFASPESAGFSSTRLLRIDRYFQQFVDSQYVAGMVAIIVKNGKVVYYKAIGYDDRDRKTWMKKDEIFRIASQTKAITSVAVMMLYEEGKFLLDDPISRYLPAFKNPRVLDKFNEQDTTYTTVPAKREITIRDLLTHLAGIDYPVVGAKTMTAIYAKAGIPSGIGTIDKTLAGEMNKLAKLPLEHQPGEKWTYGINTDVLGYLIEVVSGMSLDEFFRLRIFEPLGMKDTYFYIPKEKQNRLATLYAEDSAHHLTKAPWSKYGIRADYPNQNGTYYSGGAGLSSTAWDYAIFLQMLLNEGVYGNSRILSPSSVRMMTMNQIGDISIGDDKVNKFGLGFGITTLQGSSKLPIAEGSFDWGGYFQTTYWADPKNQIVAQLMTQMMPPFSHSEMANKFRVLVYQALSN
jgi:CubicO group peptidase (beta-lactamase class C family)